VSVATRKKVEDAMAELAYVPNQLAKNLSSQRSNLVGVVIPDIIHPFFSLFVKHIENFLYERGYMTMVCSTLGREKVEQKYLEWLNRHTMDGIIMGVHTLDVAEYQATMRPIVSLDRFLSDEIPMISSDHAQAAQLAVEMLRKNNCRNVVQFMGSGKVKIGAENFVLECKRLFNHADETMITHVMPTNTFALDDYFATAKEAFEKYPDVDAFIGSDMAITQCLKLAEQHYVDVPAKLKLIAYDGTQVTRIGPKQISAIVQPIEQLAQSAAEQLIAKIEGNSKITAPTPLAVVWQAGETTIY
jgi:LacI family sucrose operon transcriptional repressor